ncbi:MAG: aspartate aminotransferase family protein [Bacteroidetes bacterium]|nr:aspartate aminotransferase family protein [Bacteroidota bacterium]
MQINQSFHTKNTRNAPVAMGSDEFKSIGYQLIDQIAELFESLPNRPVSPGNSPKEIKNLLGNHGMPDTGTSASELFAEVSQKLFNHSTFNGHPRFWGYITASATPIGILSELLAAAINPNTGGWELSPMASEIEVQTIQWISELIGYHPGTGGLLVSGGNMANFVGFVAARCAKANWDVRKTGFSTPEAKKMIAYVSQETHTWIQKATDLFGVGTDQIRWIETDENFQIDTTKLTEAIERDLSAGNLPFMVVGTAGSVSTGVVDPIEKLSEICQKFNLWLHLDGAYGGFAAMLPEAPDPLKVIHLADSIALDPHKWLYAPLEAGCVLVKNPRHLLDAFSYHPDYYHFDDAVEENGANFYEYGMQNSRGFRALKVWMALRQAGKNGYIQMLRDDIAYTQKLTEAILQHPELEPFTSRLSIATFRFVPGGDASQFSQEYLNDLNEKILTSLKKEGKVFVSNAVINGNFLLRSCIVNFRTQLSDILALPEIVTEVGRRLV